MGEYLFTVSDVFSIKGRGIIIVPGVPTDTLTVRMGDTVELRIPNGIRVSSVIRGIEFLEGPVPSRTVPLLLRDLTKEDVPVGTEVWLPSLSARNVESWQKVREFYTGLTSRSRKWNYTPLSRLVYQLSQTEIATSFRAGTALSTLIISTAEQHGLKPGQPFVAVDFFSETWSEEGEFRVEYLNGHGYIGPERGIIKSHDCTEENVREALRPLLQRLWNDTHGSARLK